MSPRRCLGFVLIMVTALMLAVVAPVAAVPPSREEVELPEGSIIPVSGVCPFDIEILVLTSRETMTTFLDQSDNVVMQLITGPLKVRVTNVDTGESLDLNIPGPGRILEDGEMMILMGRWLNIVPQLEPPVLSLTTGRVVVERDPETGNILSFISSKGQTENLCETLAS